MIALGARAVRRMGALVHRLELPDQDAGVELGGRELGVAEQGLEVAYVGAVLEHQRRGGRPSPQSQPLKVGLRLLALRLEVEFLYVRIIAGWLSDVVGRCEQPVGTCRPDHKPPTLRGVEYRLTPGVREIIGV